MRLEELLDDVATPSQHAFDGQAEMDSTASDSVPSNAPMISSSIEHDAPPCQPPSHPPIIAPSDSDWIGHDLVPARPGPAIEPSGLNPSSSHHPTTTTESQSGAAAERLSNTTQLVAPSNHDGNGVVHEADATKESQRDRSSVGAHHQAPQQHPTSAMNSRQQESN